MREEDGALPSDHFKLAASHFVLSISFFWSGMRKSFRACGRGENAGLVGLPAPSEDNGVRPPCMILPTDAWKERWDQWMVVLILYTSAAAPFRFCFSSPANGAKLVFEQVVVASFLLDIALNFCTAHIHEGEWVFDRMRIAGRYAQGWLGVDFLSSLPVELIASFGYSSPVLSNLSVLRSLRILQLVRFVDLCAELRTRHHLSTTFIRILPSVVLLLFLVHWVACVFFYISAFALRQLYHNSWIFDYEDGVASADETSLADKYMICVYWATGALSGFSTAIKPMNFPERAFTSLCHLLGVFVLAYVISFVGRIVSRYDRHAAILEERMDHVDEYIRLHSIPHDFAGRLRRYYVYYFSRKTAFDEDDLLAPLTPPLRSDVVTHLFRHTVARTPPFSAIADPAARLELYPRFKPVATAPQEIICRKGDPAHELYLLVRGRVEVISGVDFRVLYRVRAGQCFGESAVAGRRRPATHRSATSCEIWCVSSRDIHTFAQQWPREGAILYRSLLEGHQRKEHLRHLALRLLVKKLGKEGRAEEGKVLRLQMAWDRLCDSRKYAALERRLAEQPSQRCVTLPCPPHPTRQSLSGPSSGPPLPLPAFQRLPTNPCVPTCHHLHSAQSVHEYPRGTKKHSHAASPSRLLRAMEAATKSARSARVHARVEA